MVRSSQRGDYSIQQVYNKINDQKIIAVVSHGLFAFVVRAMVYAKTDKSQFFVNYFMKT